MNKTKVHISIVSPVYMAENIVDELVRQLIISLKKITNSFEIILVEDGSPDGSWNIIEKICKDEKRVKGIKLSRNFGQHYAITAGLDHAAGEWIVVMDCDLQDRPDQIVLLYQKALEGYDLVLAQRIERNDSFFKRFFSKAFYKCFSYLTDSVQDPTVANFGIYRREVILAVLSMNDQIRYFPTMVQWVGFKKEYIPVKHAARFEGKTSYNYKRLFQLAFENIIGFSDKPLRLTMKAGFIICMVSIFLGVFFTIKYLSGDVLVAGYTSLIISIWFLSGIIIFLLGMTGIYIGKMFEKVKDRPVFIIAKIRNIQK